MRWKTAAKLAWQALRANKLRTWLTTATIATAISAIHVHYSLTVRPSERATELVERLEGQYLVVYDSLVTTLDEADLNQHQKALRQAGVTQRHDFLCAYFLRDDSPIPSLMCSQPSADNTALSELTEIVAGRNAKDGVLEAVLEYDLADSWGIKVGDRYQPYKGGAEVTVVGLFVRAAHLPTADLLLPLSAIRELKQRPSGLSFSLLEFTGGSLNPSTQKKVETLLEELHVLAPEKAAQQLRAGSRGLKLAAATLGAVITTLCIAIALFALMGAVNERKSEFAVLRSLGFSRRSVMRSVMLEGLFLGTNGTVKGIIFGELFIVLLAGQIHPILGGESRWHELLIPVCLGIFVAVIGATIPAYRACNAQPQDLLR